MRSSSLSIFPPASVEFGQRIPSGMDRRSGTRIMVWRDEGGRERLARLTIIRNPIRRESDFRSFNVSSIEGEEFS